VKRRCDMDKGAIRMRISFKLVMVVAGGIAVLKDGEGSESLE